MKYHCSEVGSNPGVDVILEKKQEAIICSFEHLWDLIWKAV